MLQNNFADVVNRPYVFLFADPNALGLSLVENLLSNFCFVKVLTEDVDLWRDKTKFLSLNNYFEVIPLSAKVEEMGLIGYLIFVDTELNKSTREINKAVKISSFLTGKKFVLFPYLLETNEAQNKLKDTKNIFLNECPDTEYFYIGDILGPGVGLNEGNLAYKVIYNFLIKQRFPEELEAFVYPVFARDITRQIGRFLFSFGPASTETSIVGEEVSLKLLTDQLTRLNPNIPTFRRQHFTKRFEVGETEKIIIPLNLRFAVKETVNWLNINKPEEVEEKIELKEMVKNKFVFPKVNFDFKSFMKVKQKLDKFPKVKLIKKPKVNLKSLSLISLVFLLLVSPFLSLMITGLLIFSSSKFLVKGNLSLTNLSLSFASRASSFSSWGFNKMSTLPLIGNVYKDNNYLTTLVDKGVILFEKGLKVYSNLSVLPTKVFGNETYAVQNLTQDASLELDSIYKELGFVQGEIDSLSTKHKKFIAKYVSSEKLSLLREKLYLGRIVLDNLPKLLGAGEVKTYLVLFQNNMELRPTGGFIGSFALITVSGGRVTNIDVQDVYSADGQLKGYVEPPEPIKKYLNSNGWFLRDSNWDPDFSKTALRVEWFLDKEINRTVDGVVGIDLELVKEILKVTGPVYLADFDKTIDYQNLYEVTQSEVENDFFPGSRKKANFLSSLSKEVINVTISNLSKNKIDLVKAIYKNLEEKHIQIYLHDKEVQKAIGKLHYDGGVSVPICLVNCYSDFVSYIDANIGVNKANYFLKRSAYLSVFYDGQEIRRVLRIAFENTANPALGDRVRYKSYLRVLASPGSVFSDSKIIEGIQENIISPDIKENTEYSEAGLLIEVLPGAQKTAEFSWSTKLPKTTDFYKEGEFGVYIRKQAGTIDDPFYLSLFIPNSVRILNNTFFSLTRQGAYVYNTNLTRDTFPRIYWY